MWKKQNVLLVRNRNMLANIILCLCVCTDIKYISHDMFVYTRKPFTLLSSHTNMHCGSTLIANECMFCYKVWPLVTKTTCCSADVNTVGSQQHNQSGNKPCWVSVFPSRSLSLTHTHTLIEGNYRAVCRVSTHTHAHTHTNRGELQSSVSGKDFCSRQDSSARWVIWPRRTLGDTLKSDSPHRPAILDGFGFLGHKQCKASCIEKKQHGLKWF